MSINMLRTVIRRSGLTQMEVAKALGVDPSYVSDWTHGKRSTALEQRAKRLGALLGVSEHAILQAIREVIEGT